MTISKMAVGNALRYDEIVKLQAEVERLSVLTANRKELDEEMWHAYRMGWMGSNGARITRISAALNGRDT
jgi:hypothetical protein